MSSDLFLRSAAFIEKLQDAVEGDSGMSFEANFTTATRGVALGTFAHLITKAFE